MPTAPQPTAPMPRGLQLGLLLTLLVPLGFSLAWLQFKRFWIDELLEWFSDTRPSAAAIVRGQLHAPFSFEPPLYHLLLHAVLRAVPGSPELVFRLPAMVEFAALQLCLAWLAWQLTQQARATLLAAALPFAMAGFAFAAEARVYIFLTLCFAAALACYFALCTRTAQAQRRIRRWAALGLFLSLGAAVLSHYFAVFLPLPFLAVELWHAARHRQPRALPLLATLGALALFALNLPFFAALAAIQANYYGAQATWSRIPFTYSFLAVGYDLYDPTAYATAVRWTGYLLAFAVLPAALWSLRRQLRQPQLPPVAASRNAGGRDFFRVLCLSLLLPVVNVAVGHWRTHSYSPRYSLPALAPMALVLALGAAPLLRRPAAALFIAALVLAQGCWFAMSSINKEQRLYAIANRAAQPTPALAAALNRSAQDPHVYVQDVAQFLALERYASPEVRSRLVAFYSLERARALGRPSPAGLFARNAGLSTTLPVLPYTALRQRPGDHILLVFDDPSEDPPDEWIGLELRTPGTIAGVESLGPALGGTLYRVRFTP